MLGIEFDGEVAMAYALHKWVVRFSRVSTVGVQLEFSWSSSWSSSCSSPKPQITAATEVSTRKKYNMYVL